MAYPMLHDKHPAFFNRIICGVYSGGGHPPTLLLCSRPGDLSVWELDQARELRDYLTECIEYMESE